MSAIHAHTAYTLFNLLHFKTSCLLFYASVLLSPKFPSLAFYVLLSLKFLQLSDCQSLSFVYSVFYSGHGTFTSCSYFRHSLNTDTFQRFGCRSQCSMAPEIPAVVITYQSSGTHSPCEPRQTAITRNNAKDTGFAEMTSLLKYNGIKGGQYH